jgi:dTDP-4-amino-4,6-dideoxygalactose transaminase
MKSKSELQQLAILGAPPAFAESLHVGRPNIGDRQRLLGRINEILDDRWLTNNGPYVQEFERRIQEMIGARHCIAMCNATVALEIAIRALEMKGEVIVPSFTFVATAHSLQWQEITPVFCDVESRTYTLDPHRIEEMITPRTTGIIAVHLWGQPCKIEVLDQISRKHGLKLLYDAAHAFACSHKGIMIGNFGDAEVFSFHATKFFNTFEGGAVVTNNDQLAQKIRLMKNFGFSGYDNVIYVGTNGKMSEVSAAMGVTGLESLHDFIEVNRRNYNQYAHELKDLAGIRLHPYNEFEKTNYQYIILEVDDRVARINRDHLVKVLHAENVLARRYFHPGCHLMEPYRSYFPHAGLLLPVTRDLSRRVLSLPTGTAVTSQDISTICQIIRLALSKADELRKVLKNASHRPANP